MLCIEPTCKGFSGGLVRTVDRHDHASKHNALHGDFPSNRCAEEVADIPIARRHLGICGVCAAVPAVDSRVLGVVHLLAFHIASTVAAIFRATVNFAKFGFVPCSHKRSYAARRGLGRA